MQRRLFEYRRRPSTPAAPADAKSLIGGSRPRDGQRPEETCPLVRRPGAAAPARARSDVLYGAVVTVPWFEFGDDEAEVCPPFQREFLRVVRDRARDWPCSPESTYVLFWAADEADGNEPPPGREHMRLVIDLSNRQSIFLSLGALLEGDTVLCTQLHACTLTPAEERADIVPRSATGSAEELAGFTADWFDAVLRLPLLEYDGRRDGFPAVT